MTYDLNKWRNLRFAREADGRYYRVSLEQDIWGRWLLKTVWGGKTKSAGVANITPVADIETAESMIERIRDRRISHGYHLSA